jgi:hypothetical protein
MSSESTNAQSPELVTALSVVEEQPLDTRAEGYAKLYDQLRVQLEDADSSQRD